MNRRTHELLWKFSSSLTLSAFFFGFAVGGGLVWLFVGRVAFEKAANYPAAVFYPALLLPVPMAAAFWFLRRAARIRKRELGLPALKDAGVRYPIRLKSES